MNKTPIQKETLKKVIATTQNIEGYKEAGSEVVAKVKELKAKYGVKVSAKK
ncbi:MAG TPA: hypothetical protein PLV58_06400 [Campylobacterales bacterium]|nr:hypothetical protein [Campylobacterales bacterium]